MASSEHDPGPPVDFADHLAALPDYGPFKPFFWHDWGPVFYRGRLDGSAKLLCVASDPGATERIAGRCLVGDAGQRVQGFLAKVGLTRSYLCVNVYCHGLIPAKASKAMPMLSQPAHLTWRNRLYDLAKTSSVRAVVAFGVPARTAMQLWPASSNLPVFTLPHPSSRDAARLARAWRDAVTSLRQLVAPDPGVADDLPNYGEHIVEADYAVIPRCDLPFGVPAFLGDDRWVRAGAKGFSSVSRPKPDDRHTLIWKAPKL
jgi:uracil-DNA glycosylase